MGIARRFGPLLALLVVSGASGAAAADRPVISGEYEVGERFTRLDDETDVFDAAPDSAGNEGYTFRDLRIEIEQPIAPRVGVSARYEQVDRDYFSGFETYDNVTRSATLRARFDPSKRMGVSLTYRVDDRTYLSGESDNDVETLEWEVRFRRGEGENYTVGFSTRGVEFAGQPERDRSVARYRVSAVRPVTEALKVTVRAAAERFDFENPSPRRQPGIQRSASLSFRYEL